MGVSDLLHETAALVDIASVSRHETAIADHVERELRSIAGLDVTRIEDNVVARTSLGRSQRLVIAGHLDTVPPSGNETARIEGDVLHGVGSADMKGGVAVALSLARQCLSGALDTTYVFYACEEIARQHSGLKVLERRCPDLLQGDAAVLCEPTGALIEAGCQGVLRVRVTIRGRRAHSARPWVGINAIHRVGLLLQLVDGFVERRPMIDGCEYRETLQAVAITGGVAGNVVPDEVVVTLSHRFAPDRDVEAAFDALVGLLGPAIDATLGDELIIEDSAPAAAPMLGHPLLAELVRRSGKPPRAKIAWTDVAFFAERGIPSANFGPGDPLVAHSADEHVLAHELDDVFQTLARLVEHGAQVAP